jgi:hypothetical protein
MKLHFGPIRTLEGVSLAFLLMLVVSDRTGTTNAFTVGPLTARGAPKHVVTSHLRSIQMESTPQMISTPLWAKTSTSYRSSLPVIMEEAEIHNNKATATVETSTTTLKRKSTDPTPVIFSLVQNIKQEPTMAVVAFSLALVLMLSPTSATAAMSGNLREDSFPSQRSSPSLSIRPTSSRSYGGGYSRGSSYSRLFHSVYGIGSRALHSVDGKGLATDHYSPPQVRPFSPFGIPSILRINALE